MDNQQKYDIAIVGTGPAGLEAALTAKARNKSILLLGNSSLSDKVVRAHGVQNYLGLPNITGKDLQQAFAGHLAQAQIPITQDRVNTIFAMGEFFVLQGNKQEYQATTVILACGLSTVKPFPGELENLGRGVSYCATCDAGLYRDKNAIVVGYLPEEEAEVNFLAEIATKVWYLPMYDYQPQEGLPDNIEVLVGQKPESITREGRKTQLKLGDTTLEADGLFILRSNVAPAQLVPGLELEKNLVPVNRHMETNIPGMFACGDITGAPYQYIKAAGEGNVAALTAVKYLAEHK